MGRLIEAGLVLDNLSGRLESMKDYDAVKDVINNMPTAYDVDKVVKQLETMRMRYYLTYANTGNKTNDEVWEKASRAMDDAIEIVKAGGNANLLIDRAKSKSGERIPYDGKWK